MKRHVLPFVIAAVLLSPEARGEWMQGKGEHHFGPDMSENRACDLAEQRARKDAIKKATGELLAADDFMVCREEKDKASCDLNRMTLSTISGVIRGTKKQHREIAPGVADHKKCIVVLEVDVGEGVGRYDPSFDMSVVMNNRTFRSGEPLEITVTPNDPMYITVFQWLPYEKAQRQVQKIFPNQFDTDNHFRKSDTIPTKEKRSRYDLTVGFPQGVKGQRDRVDEYLMVVGTRNPVKFRAAYTLEELNSRLLEIPRPDQRMVRKGYYVVER